MTGEQALLFSLFGLLFVLLLWGRIRYDLVAFSILVAAALLGLLDYDEVFSGFGHPAVVIIALVLIVSRGLLNSGAVELVSRRVIDTERSLPAHIGIMASVGAAMSAVINNVAALALLMTLDMDAAKKAKRAVSLSLMPLSFATILGGMVTLIGTPPNIVIAQYRERALGDAYGMFDFTPVGLPVAIAGIAFVALVGWRLIPARSEAGSLTSASEADLYVSEARVPEKSPLIGTTTVELYPLANEYDINVLGLVRRGRRLPGFARGEKLRKGDFLILEGDPKGIESFMGAAKLDFAGSEKHGDGIQGKSLVLREVLVPESARIAGRSALDVRLLYDHGITLLGVSRGGRRFRERVRRLPIRAGDLLLLLGPPQRIGEVAAWLGVMELAGRRTPVLQRAKAGAALAFFGAAVAAAVAGIASLPVALAACVIAYAAAGIVSGREVYESVDWKVVVLLASLIPLGGALEDAGGTALIAGQIVDWTAGYPAWVVLAVVMVVTMTLSDFLNNVATALVVAPVGVGVAQSIGASPDAFLMGIAVAASCAFLTPIGHKNNTIILGPGGYRFGDYWRMGLPLEIVVLAVAIPSILYFWPL